MNTRSSWVVLAGLAAAVTCTVGCSGSTDSGSGSESSSASAVTIANKDNAGSFVIASDNGECVDMKTLLDANADAIKNGCGEGKIAVPDKPGDPSCEAGKAKGVKFNCFDGSAPPPPPPGMCILLVVQDPAGHLPPDVAAQIPLDPGLICHALGMVPVPPPPPFGPGNAPGQGQPGAPAAGGPDGPQGQPGAPPANSGGGQQGQGPGPMPGEDGQYMCQPPPPPPAPAGSASPGEQQQPPVPPAPAGSGQPGGQGPQGPGQGEPGGPVPCQPPPPPAFMCCVPPGGEPPPPPPPAEPTGENK